MVVLVVCLQAIYIFYQQIHIHGFFFLFSDDSFLWFECWKTAQSATWGAFERGDTVCTPCVPAWKWGTSSQTDVKYFLFDINVILRQNAVLRPLRLLQLTGIVDMNIQTKLENSFQKLTASSPFLYSQEGSQNSWVKKPKTGANKWRGAWGEAWNSFVSSLFFPRWSLNALCTFRFFTQLFHTPSQLSRKGLLAVYFENAAWNRVLTPNLVIGIVLLYSFVETGVASLLLCIQGVKLYTWFVQSSKDLEF